MIVSYQLLFCLSTIGQFTHEYLPRLSTLRSHAQSSKSGEVSSWDFRTVPIIPDVDVEMREMQQQQL